MYACSQSNVDLCRCGFGDSIDGPSTFECANVHRWCREKSPRRLLFHSWCIEGDRLLYDGNELIVEFKIHLYQPVLNVGNGFDQTVDSVRAEWRP